MCVWVSVSVCLLSLSQVFCVHGGIPLPTLGKGLITSIAEVPVTLSDPMEESPLAWDIMWNDPIRYSCIHITHTIAFCYN